jgi:hypothetical protein
MPRKSTAEQLVKQVPFEPVRPDAPYFLNDEEAEVWRRIVGSLPADYFAAFQWDLLTELCGHLIELRYVKRQLEAERRKRKPNLKVAKDWKLQWSKETTTVNQLMRAMRLTHQSVYDKKVAIQAHQAESGVEHSAGAKVWALNGDAEAEAEI